jgi:hypothetical protein
MPMADGSSPSSFDMTAEPPADSWACADNPSDLSDFGFLWVEEIAWWWVTLPAWSRTRPTWRLSHSDLYF